MGIKRAVSISLGSSKRDKAVELDLLNSKVSIERIGTDGDMEKAAQLYKELDGKVDAFGVGGADLGLMVDQKWYPLYSVGSMVRFIKETPVVDGTGLKNTLEARIGPFLNSPGGLHFCPWQKGVGDLGADRWGMTRTFVEHGYECVFGDLMFGLGIPLAIRSPEMVKCLARAGYAPGRPVAFRMDLSHRRETGNADPQMGKVLRLGDSDCRRPAFCCPLYARSSAREGHRHEHDHA